VPADIGLDPGGIPRLAAGLTRCKVRKTPIGKVNHGDKTRPGLFAHRCLNMARAGR
jgi:hypothetical protein